MLLSCICFGIGEALLLAAFAGTAGLGAHAATCKPGPGEAPPDPMAPTCCGHDHHPGPDPVPELGAAAALTPEGLPGSTTDYDPHFTPRFLERQGSPGMSSALRTTTVIALLGFAAFMVATCSGTMFGHEHAHSADTEPCGAVHDHHEVVHEHVG